MTLRFTIAENYALDRLVWAGDGVCCCCAKAFMGRSPQGTKNSDPTVEHVFPRSPRAADLSRIKALLALVIWRNGKPQAGRKAAAHASCNRKKANRPPTGCEIVFLMAVNDRLRGAPVKPDAVYATKAEKRRAKRQRDQERRRAAAMQAELSA